MKLGPQLILFFFVVVNLAVNSSKVHAANQMDCEGIRHPAYMDEYRACLRANIAAEATEAGVDCVDCIFDQAKSNSNGWVEGLGVLAQPLAYLAASYVTSKQQHEINKVWANAYESGHKECTNRFNSYIDYNTTVGANPLLPADVGGMIASCNGYGYGSYAGYGGYLGNGLGGYGNPFQGMGYSSGFMNGMMGPYGYAYYGTGSMYGAGMMSGGIGLSGYAGTNSVNTSGIFGSTDSGITTAFGF